MMTDLSQAANVAADSASTRQVLSALWKSRLDTLIGAIANNEQYYKEIANAAEHVSAEYFGRFLVELIQNANDQAIRASTTGCVTIVRAADVIAVGNVGEPFDEKKVDEITSIFLSSKSVSECVGNKGVGFKAVFQIADSAEIYSAKPHTSLAQNLNLGFRIVRQPFSCEAFRDTLASIVAELLSEQPHRHRAIAERFDTEDVCDTVLREAERAAWFKFPLEADSDCLSNRLRQLGANTSGIRECQTIVVLPIDSTDDKVQELVESAIDDIAGHNRDGNDSLSGASLLFLSGLDRLDVVDQVRGFKAEITRGKPELREMDDDEVVIQRFNVRTTISNLITRGDASPRPLTQRWWVASALFGTTSEEKETLRQAIVELRLPPENWKDVSTAPVSIALPCRETEYDDGATLLPLPANGRFCIGLPSKMPTGSPLWVNAPFHGTIARTDIRLENHYNRILFEKALALVGKLASRFKRDTDLRTRRLATLLMRRGNGPLAEKLYASEGLAESAIVLTDKGDFLTAAGISMPEEKDIEIFSWLIRGLDDTGEFGFTLPDRGLLLSARDVLDDLCPHGAISLEAYLTRGKKRESLLERAARSQRSCGEEFWKPFLDWIVSKQWPDGDALRDQAIIPVRSSSLEKASSRVFFRPFTSQLTDDEAEVDIDADDELELRELDDSVADLLKLFDESALSVRLPNSKKYTVTATRLASTGRSGLVNRPRLEDLLNQAVIPALKGAVVDNDKALRLLNQAILWLNQMEPKSLARVRTEELLVPGYERTTRAWTWVSPASAYLGEGWEDGKSSHLLTELYGRRPGAQLVPWSAFEKKARPLFGAINRKDWANGMRNLGVWDCPRVVSLGRKMPVLLSYDYGPPLTTNPEVLPPVGCDRLAWETYLDRIRYRRSYNKTVLGSNKFYISEVLWIDGLESEALRPTVVEAVLRRADRYQPHLNVRLSRFRGEDPSEAPALWLHALQQMDWAVFPTTRGRRTSKDAWWIQSSDRRKRRFQLLPAVPSEYADARSLLGTIGIHSLDESSIRRLITALHAIAAQLPECKQDELRYAGALATDVYELLNQRIKDTDSPDGLSEILSALVPLESTEGIVSAELSKVDCIYLNDDAIRAEHVVLPESRYMIPSRFDPRYPALINALGNLLGAERISRVSNQAIAIHFDPTSKAVRLIDYLRTNFPNKSILEDLALLIVQGGGRPLDPRGQRFEQRWNRFCATNLVFGTFDDEATQACFDRNASGGPTLMVAHASTRYDVVSCSWQIVDKACEDTWILFAAALEKGEESKFLTASHYLQNVN